MHKSIDISRKSQKNARNATTGRLQGFHYPPKTEKHLPDIKKKPAGYRAVFCGLPQKSAPFAGCFFWKRKSAFHFSGLRKPCRQSGSLTVFDIFPTWTLTEYRAGVTPPLQYFPMLPASALPALAPRRGFVSVFFHSRKVCYCSPTGFEFFSLAVLILIMSDADGGFRLALLLEQLKGSPLF